MARADIEWIGEGKKLEWAIANYPEVQAELRSKARKGARIGKGIAMKHFVTGELAEKIDVSATPAPPTAQYPVTDWVVEFKHPWIGAIEYGHISRGFLGTGGFIKGIRIAHKTMRAM